MGLSSYRHAMKLSNLPAAWYGLVTSSASAFAFAPASLVSWPAENNNFAFATTTTTTRTMTMTTTTTTTKNTGQLSHHRRARRRSTFLDGIANARTYSDGMNHRQEDKERRTTSLEPPAAAATTAVDDESSSSSSSPAAAGATTTTTTTAVEPKDHHRSNKFDASVPTFRLFYNDVYEVELPPRHRFPMGKYRKVRERVQKRIQDQLAEDDSTHLSVDSDFCVSPLATFEELCTTHDSTYIQRFLDGDQTAEEQRNVGFPWSRQGVDRAISSVGGTLAAARFVCEHERDRKLKRHHHTERHEEEEPSSSSVSPTPPPPPRARFPAWAAHIAGGTHHAFYDYGEGFSVFSDMAVAANVVLEEYPDIVRNNILMIDLDVHQGNGNAVLFQNGPHADRVTTFSMHCAGNYFSQKQESDLDIELPVGCKDQAYLMTLNHWLRRFRTEHRKARNSDSDSDSGASKGDDDDDGKKPRTYRWDLILFQAGVDVLDDDRLGRMALSPGGVARRNELVYEFARDLDVPMVICMGGGYPKRDDAWESILATHSDVYFGAHRFLDSWLRDEREPSERSTAASTKEDRSS